MARQVLPLLVLMESRSFLNSVLPYETPPLPKKWAWARPGAYALVTLVLILTMLQFHRGTMKRASQAQEAATDKDSKGAIGRWRADIRQFWSGENIYLSPVPVGMADPRPHDGWRATHPNMPFVVLLLTPFAYMPVWLMALSYNLIKFAAIIMLILMAVRIANHKNDRMPDWLAFLGVLAGIDFLIGDIQHGNTNSFVALAVIGHLWLFRKKHDVWAGAALALGICLKLTPALFLLYWVYQREWRVLGGTAAGLAFMMLAPAVFIDWEFYALTTGTWLREIIYPGLSGVWYPMHINQSLPAMIARYFTGGVSGNYYVSEPGSEIGLTQNGWITVINMGPVAARWLLRALQAGIVLAAAWAVGYRKLPRDDGRRGLHYGMLCAMMLLLNQRSWDHHATYLILADMALVYSITYGRISPRLRFISRVALVASVVLLNLLAGDILKAIFGETGADRVAAYGTTFWHFLVIWLLCLILARRLRDVCEPYPQRTPAVCDVERLNVACVINV